MFTLNSVFDAFEGPAGVGRIIGKTTEHAAAMRRRGSIPVRYWPALLAEAERRDLVAITEQALLEAHTGPERRKAA